MSTQGDEGTSASPRPLTQAPPPPQIATDTPPAVADDAPRVIKRPGAPAPTDRTQPRPAPDPVAQPAPAPPAQPAPTSQASLAPVIPPAQPATAPPPLRQAPPPAARTASPRDSAQENSGVVDATKVQASLFQPAPAASQQAPTQAHGSGPTQAQGSSGQAHGQSSGQSQYQSTRRFAPQTYSLKPRDPRVLGSYLLMGRVLSPDEATDHNRPVVYLGEGPDQVLVIVKAARIEWGWEAQERLRREARNAARIDSNQVAAIVQGAEEDQDYLYIVQQYVQGTPLDRLLDEKPGRQLAPQDSLRLSIGLLSALRAVHGAGVTHRDIKPGNIIVTADGPVIVDFGNSHHEDDDRITTRGGQRWGTPKYMSPEQFDEMGVSSSIDLFGWGVTIVESASGHHPYAEPGTQPNYQHLNGRVAANVSGVPVDLIPVVRTALEKDPRRRSTAGYLERRLVRSDRTIAEPQGVVDIPLPSTEKSQLERPKPGLAIAAWKLGAEDALVDDNRWFAAACLIAVLLAVPVGVILHILWTMIF